MINDTFSKGLNKVIELGGVPIRVLYLKQTIGSVWDDEVSLSQSGAVIWTSGLVLPLSNKWGSTDSLLMEQGKLNNSDRKLYVNGSLLITGSELQVKIMIGSNTIGTQYSIIPDGIIMFEVAGQPIYKKVFLRRLTGSILGEA